MKTIEISDEMYERFMNLSKELNIQDHLATAMPYLFQIRDFKKVSADDWFEDGYFMIDSDWEWDFDFSEILVKEAIDQLESYWIEDIPENIKNCTDMDVLEEWLIDEHSFYKWNYQKIDVFSNWFFTKKSAQEFLDSNDYHFSNEAHVYLSHLWRNPEMETVMKFLCELSWWKIHK